jgi:release factor glutamine methyltransferase
VTTRRDARTAASERLRRSDDETAALDADLLLAQVCRISKEELYAHLEALLTAEEERSYEALVARRAAGEPVAYIRGFKEFFGLRLAVDERVLIPRPETEVIVETALAFLRRTGRSRVIDVGTGSGAIAVAIAVSEPRARIVATDVSAAALEVARANAMAHGVAGRVELRQGDLLAPITQQADIVAANLPYLSESTSAGARASPERGSEWERTSLFFEPREAVVAGPDGLDVIRRFLVQLPRVLAPGGAVLLECDPPQAEPIRALVGAAVGPRTRVIPDLAGSARVVEGVR